MISIAVLFAAAALLLFTQLYHLLRSKRPKGTQDLPGPSGMSRDITFGLQNTQSNGYEVYH